ncbi:high affinity immunoglobulin epsilon receptor subunit alpha-like [Leuresthes tenuis]|uniref:high affinity immunoglobulin epsilon receptor subunit alpha-like n=1 Tax=Leuresthes tenuis TaxID=355514 RepID=UPI003B50A66E
MAAGLCVTLWLSILLPLAADLHDSDDGQKDAGSVILESPVDPVVEGEAVTLLCKNNLISTNLTADFYKDNELIGSSNTGAMIIYNVSKSDAGQYKCRVSGAGESPENWLFVKAGVILECPAHPVKGGDSVTLRCRKHNDPTTRIADFYRHGVHINTGYNGEMIIHSASKSDEGPYKCSISGFGESAESWLAVQENGNFVPEKSPENSVAFGGSHLYILLSFFFIVVFLAVLLLVGGLHFRKKRAMESTASEAKSVDEDCQSEAGSEAYL